MITIDEAKAYRLSKNFTLYEFLHSDTAILKGLMHEQCSITEKEIVNLKRLCENVLQPLREYIKKPIRINSGYRSLTLNTALKGSPNSEHMRGMAADIWCPDMPTAWAFMQRLNFRQLIKYGEFRFIHISYNEFDNKKQILQKA
jgi:zinc D-Ala-D-Ala carboxypeptidase